MHDACLHQNRAWLGLIETITIWRIAVKGPVGSFGAKEIHTSYELDWMIAHFGKLGMMVFERVVVQCQSERTGGSGGFYFVQCFGGIIPQAQVGMIAP